MMGKAVFILNPRGRVGSGIRITRDVVKSFIIVVDFSATPMIEKFQ